MFVLDSHCDTPSQIHRLRNIGIRNLRGQVDLPKMREGGVDGAFFALYVPPALGPAEATSYAMELLADVRDALAANRDKAVLVTSAEEAYAARTRGLIAIFLGLENGSAIQKSLPLLRLFFDMGVRYVTLAHSGHNEICDSCAPAEARWGGLSPFGREVVAEMNRLGMLIDVSHISDRSFFDVLECSSAPIVATHSCCRALAGHKRNMTDEMIMALAEAGGVIQINFYPVFLDDAFADTPIGANHRRVHGRISRRPALLDDLFDFPHEIRHSGYVFCFICRHNIAFLSKLQNLSHNSLVIVSLFQLVKERCRPLSNCGPSTFPIPCPKGIPPVLMGCSVYNFVPTSRFLSDKAVQSSGFDTTVTQRRNDRIP